MSGRAVTKGVTPPGGDQPVHALVLPDATTALCGRTATTGLGRTISYAQPRLVADLVPRLPRGGEAADR
jgi:hypothetical protein